MAAENENPYAAPASDSALVAVEPPELYGTIPLSIRLVLVGLVAIAAVTLATLTIDLIYAGAYYSQIDLSLVVLCVILFGGVCVRTRLAKRFGRVLFALLCGFLTLLLIGIAIAATLTALFDPISFADLHEIIFDVDFTAFLLVFAASWLVFLALGTSTAREYFKLFCPKCNSRRTKAANFFYTKAKCKECGAVW